MKNGTNAIPRFVHAQHRVVRAVVDVVLVLHAHHRRDRESLVDVLLGDVGKAQVPDKPHVTEFRERPEMLRDRWLPHAT